MNSKKNTYPTDDFVYGGKNGQLFYPSNKSYPGAKFKNKGDLLRLILDLNKFQILLTINNKNYGVVPYTIHQTNKIIDYFILLCKTMSSRIFMIISSSISVFTETCSHKHSTAFASSFSSEGFKTYINYEKRKKFNILLKRIILMPS